MLVEIPQILTGEQLALVRRMLADAPFIEGKRSAGLVARRVKNNMEVDPEATETTRLNQLVLGSLYQNTLFRSAALPHRISGAFFARYGVGMSYGDHIDDPVMGEETRYRSDIAVTVFLSEAESYRGGELVIRTSFGTKEVKLAAGDAVIYPASSLHQVKQVTQGERLVAVAWVQSLVRDPAKRELLYDLDLARQSLRNVTPDALVTAKVDSVFVNLVRMWAEV